MLASASDLNSDVAARSTAELGLDLYRRIGKENDNLCLSPYSISCALAMTLSGADGKTRNEMARVLHLEAATDPDASFSSLQKAVSSVAGSAVKNDGDGSEHDQTAPAITMQMANRLFPQTGYELHPEFLARLSANYGAALEPLDFRANAARATSHINDWVAEQTHDRIQQLIAQPLDPTTRLVLVNAIYLKAAWAHQFSERATKPEPFHVRGREAVNVPTMQKLQSVRYAARDRFVALGLPYAGSELQLLILLPKDLNGWEALDRTVDAATLLECAKSDYQNVVLHLPRFKLEPPTIPLSQQLQGLGMKSAFDIPRGSANFDRMATRKPNDYLAVSDVFHKSFVAVDENGTEAAAATAVAMITTSAVVRPQPTPMEVKVDRPFIFAIQHVPSGACLFLGRVTDPR